jgi:hypothetical protein
LPVICLWRIRNMTLHKLLDRLFSKRVIVNCDRDPYLHRWFVVRRDVFALFVHKFIRSDEDRALHDHPWDFIVIPIWRGYYEQSESGKRRVLPLLGTRFRRGTYRHRVELLRKPYKDVPVYVHVGREMPSWSLFIRFRKWRDWGFWEKTGFIQWQAWWNEKCE